MSPQNTQKKVDTELTASCMNYNTLLKYLRRHYGDISSIFDGFDFTEEYISDPNNWIDLGAGKRLFHRVKEFTGNRDPRFFFEIGRETENLESLGVLQQVVRLLPSPRIVLQRAPEFNRRFNTLFEMHAYDLRSRSAKIDVLWRQDLREDFIYDQCPWNFGIITAIPHIWKLPDMEITEETCTFRLDEVVDGGYGYLHIKSRFENGRFYVDNEEYAHEVLAEDGSTSLGYLVTKDLVVDGTLVLKKGIIYGASCCTAELSWETKGFLRNLYDLTLGRRKLERASQEALLDQVKYTERQFREIQRLNQELQQYTRTLERTVEERTAQYREEKEKAEALVEELKVAQADLVEAEQLAGVAQLGFGLGHDLRNILSKAIQSGIPVAGVLGDLRELGNMLEKGDLARAGGFAEERNLGPRLDKATTSYQSMNDALANALDSVRALEGYATEDGSDFTELSVEEVLQRVLRDYEDRLRGIAVETSFVDRPYKVNGNPLKLYRVFLNILLNAVEALEAQADPRLTIRTEIEDGRHLTVIEDNGVGIGDEARKNLFRPFFTTKGMAAGRQRGLGLHTAYRLVQEHGGKLTVDSVRGEYTRVLVHLDIVD